MSFTQTKRPETVRVAHSDQRVFCAHDQRIGALYPVQRFDQGFLETMHQVFGQQVHEYFRIHGGTENRPLPLEFLPQFDRVYQIAVVSDRIMVVSMENNEGLRVCQKGRSGGGIAHMPDGKVALEGFKSFFSEYVMDQTHVFMVL